MGRKRKGTLQVVHPNCAGIDIGKAKHYVAVPEGADEHAVRTFASFTDELECHRARLRRLDSARAIKATAHQLARLIYAMLTWGEAYVERGIEHFDNERRERQLRHLQRQARHLNLALVPAEQVA